MKTLITVFAAALLFVGFLFGTTTSASADDCSWGNSAVCKWSRQQADKWLKEYGPIQQSSSDSVSPLSLISAAQAAEPAKLPTPKKVEETSPGNGQAGAGDSQAHGINQGKEVMGPSAATPAKALTPEQQLHMKKISDKLQEEAAKAGTDAAEAAVKTAVEPIKSQIAELKHALDEAQEKLAGLESKSTSTPADMASFTAQVAAANALAGRVATLEAKPPMEEGIANLGRRLSVADADITQLKGRVDTMETEESLKIDAFLTAIERDLGM